MQSLEGQRGSLIGVYRKDRLAVNQVAGQREGAQTTSHVQHAQFSIVVSQRVACG